MRPRLGGTALLACALVLAPLTFLAPAQAVPVKAADGDKTTFAWTDPAPKFPASKTPQPFAPKSARAAAGEPIPTLNSLPGSTHTIYLDFDGVTLASPNKWVTQEGVAAGTYGGFSLDGSADFSVAEVAFMTKTWRILAEKYSPWDINVTTVDPGVGGVTRDNVADVTFGTHMVVSSDTALATEICAGCSGKAWNDTFGKTGLNDYRIGFTLSSRLPSGSAQYNAHTAAHEVGHTIGLGHDGGPANPSYYGGHANWVPIMGISNQQAVAQFSKGEYTGANNFQDDVAVIGSHGNVINGPDGLYRPDDYGSGSTPTALGDQASYTVNGVIEKQSDDDLFSITRTCTSPLNVSATGIGIGQTLDIKLDILDAGNTVIGAGTNPASGQTTGAQPDGDIGYTPTGMNSTASLASTTNGTTYRIRVDGQNNGTGTSGYTDYASIGQYTLTISGCASSPITAPATFTATPNARTTTGTLNWTAPSSSGGNPITGYVITGLPGGTVNTANVTTYAATGLVPGTTYNLTIAAKTAVETGPTKAATLKVDTWAPTAKPVLTAGRTGTTANLSWTAPANPGGAVLTGWRITATGASSFTEDLPAGTLSKDYPGLSVGTHTYTVRGLYTATDTAGIQTSDPQSVGISTVPGAPLTATATPTARTTTGTVNWTAPADNGGSAITGYQITGLPGGTVNVGNVTTYGATNLNPGTTYNVDVKAVNANGAGPAKSTTLTVVTWAPTTKPGLTANLSGTTGQLTWTAPANPGNAVLTGWRVVGTGATSIDDTINNPATLAKNYPGLAAGTTTFTVTGIYTATDTAGIVASDPKSVIVTSVPTAPQNPATNPASRATTGTITWQAPANNGGSPITGYTITGLPTGTQTLGNVLTYNATGLNPGTTYNLEIRAVNANGASAPAATSIRVATWAPLTRPVVTVGISGTTANLSWTVPANPGNAVLTGWQVNRTGPGVLPANQTLGAAVLSTTMTNLVAGSHTFTVTGTYTADDTAGILPSDPKTGVVTTAPSVPQNLVATPTARTTTGTVSWQAPSSNGGSAITGYTVTGLPGGDKVLGNVLTYAATGLVPGTTYTVGVYARNAVGNGTATSTDLTVATWAPTTKPVLTAGLTGNTANLSWTAPANPGGATLTGWKIVATGASSFTENLPAAPLTKSYPGLAIGTHTFTVTGIYTATDTAGIVASDPKSVTVASTPLAPQNVTATPTPRTTTGTVTWQAPLSDGGSPITGYKVTGLPTGEVNVGASTFSVPATGLVPGTTYTVGVQAITVIGGGPVSSTTLTVATWAPTAAPVLTATASGSTANLSWTAPPTTGGAVLTGWRIIGTGASAGLDETLPAAPLTKAYPNLPAGTHTFTVTGVYTATDTAGVQASAPKSVTITTAPGVPQDVLTTPASRATTATISWQPPASTGGSAITGYTVTGLPGGDKVLGNVLTYAATGLVPGTTYTVGVHARNVVGDGTAATKSLTVLTWAPTTKPVLTAGLTGSTANLSWTVPANPGGATLTGWHVVGSGPGNTIDETLPAGTLSKAYPNLALGTQTFTVTGVYTADDTAGVQTSDPKSVVVSSTPGAPASLTASPAARTTTATLTWTAPSDTGGSAITGYQLSGLETAGPVLGNVLTYTATNLVPGKDYTVGIRAINANGPGNLRTTTLRIDTWAPSAKPVLTVTRTGTSATLTWTAPANPGNAVLTGWKIVGTGASAIDETVPAAPLSKTYTGLAVGTHTFTVTGIYTADDPIGAQPSDPKTATVPPPVTKPGAPKIGTPSSGAVGGARNAVARWAAPVSNGGSAITSYKVIAYKLTASGAVTKAYYSTPRSATARSYTWALPTGRYKFRVLAYNKLGASPYSPYSKIVLSR